MTLCDVYVLYICYFLFLDEVIHVTRRQSKQGDVIDDVTVYAGLQGTMPDVDVSQGRFNCYIVARM